MWNFRARKGRYNLMTPTLHLLAKSSSTPDKPEYYETYVGHLIETTRVARHLVQEWGAVYLESVGLREQAWVEKLEKGVTRGSFLHDIGKANHQFQRLVKGDRRSPQAFRHEQLSLLLALKWNPLACLLDMNESEDVTYGTLFAVLGHHLKFDNLTMLPKNGTGDSRIIIYTGHPDVNELLQHGQQLLSLPLPTGNLSNNQLDLFGDPMKEVRDWLQNALLWWNECDEKTKRFIALTKALVIGSDLVASAVSKEGDPLAWVDSVLRRVCNRQELLEVVTSGLKGNKPWPFQEKVAGTPARVTLIHAGCGSGKTLAAYMWAAEKAQGRKVFFCYPTTGTATQGYSDYAFDGLDSHLIHSRSEVDLEMLRESRGDEVDTFEPIIRYESLSVWDSPLIITTADTVLGLIQNNRRGLFSLPAIANGSFIFDEIHSYDERLFSALLRFIHVFSGSQVLLMTASLQSDRLRRIRDILSLDGETMEVVGGPKEIEDVKRYRIVLTGKESPWREVLNTVGAGGKVLWVANTVERARKVWYEAKRNEIDEPLIYHSRYRYLDRVDHHRKVVDAMKKGGGSFVVATQVCEVSLDISADLLVTDLAPVPAMIQRMGRVNRHPDATEPKPVYIIDIESIEPYSEKELKVGRKWLEELVADAGEVVSQADLAKKFASYEVNESEDTVSVRSSWLDGGPFTEPTSLREEGYTVSVVMEEDSNMCITHAGRPNNREIARYSIPMPFWPVLKELHEWKRLNGTFVAPKGKIEYSEKLGGAWKS